MKRTELKRRVSLQARGTVAVSWGPYGGFYVLRSRVCVGWLAFTYCPVELDDMMEAYVLWANPTMKCEVHADCVLLEGHHGKCRKWRNKAAA